MCTCDDVDALAREEASQVSSDRQGVDRGREQRGAARRAGAVEGLVVAPEDEHVVAAPGQHALLRGDGRVDAAALAHEVVDDEDPHLEAARSRTTRAGTPATTVSEGTSLVTTAPAATTEPTPSDTPASTVQPAPSQQSSPTTIVFRSTPCALIGRAGVVEVVVLREQGDARPHEHAVADLDVAGAAHEREVADVRVVPDLEALAGLTAEDVGRADHGLAAHGAPVTEDDAAPGQPDDLAPLLEV